jgi:cytochrome bd-type quinol oxidase subunit 2
MDTTALILSRLQFAFTISFHIIFPAFSIGLAAWLTILEALHLNTGRPAYRVLFEFWLKIFGVAFGLGVVSGVVMAFPVWHELERAAFVLTIEESAAPQSSLAFMFWGEGLFVFPLMLFYTAISYSVFRGKVKPVSGDY